ncbi:MAG: hypothetical protein ACPGU7_10410 [Gammaproteobacteria bacterium]
MADRDTRSRSDDHESTQRFSETTRRFVISRNGPRNDPGHGPANRSERHSGGKAHNADDRKAKRQDSARTDADNDLDFDVAE